MKRTRLTQAERRADTRARLMDSAARLFARRGLRDASIDDVSEEAGFSKGAFYAHFRSKEELFLAMLDDRFAERLQELEDALASDEPPERQAHKAGADYARHITADPEWKRLFLEFATYALRNEDFRQELSTRYAAIRARMLELYERRAERVEFDSPIPLEEVVLMTCAMTDGFALNRLLEPDMVDDAVYSRMLAIFFTGLVSIGRESPDGAG